MVVINILERVFTTSKRYIIGIALPKNNDEGGESGEKEGSDNAPEDTTHASSRTRVYIYTYIHVHIHLRPAKSLDHGSQI